MFLFASAQKDGLRFFKIIFHAGVINNFVHRDVNAVQYVSKRKKQQKDKKTPAVESEAPFCRKAIKVERDEVFKGRSCC